MDHLKILSRAWTITWRYRALWLLGFLFALAGGGGGGGFGGGSRGGNGGSRSGGGGGGGGWPFGTIPSIDWNMVLIIALVVVAVIIVLAVIMTIVRYVAETAMMAGVDEIESTGVKLTVRRGFRLGWSRRALRLFLTDLAVYVPLAALAIVLVILALSPLLLLSVKIDAVSIIAGVICAGLELLVILFIVVVALAVSVVMPYIRRRVVLGQQGVLVSIRQSLMLARASLMDTGLMWLSLIGVRILQGIAMIPVLILVVALSVLIGGVPAGLVYLLSHSWVAAVLVGVPLFLIALVPPITFVRGLFEIYQSTSWTLAYRDVTARHADLLPVLSSV
jgi:hypothetical protein